MYSDPAIKYKSLLQDIELILDNISKMGFDSEKYRNEFLLIKNSINDKDSISLNSDRAVKHMNITMEYEKAISELTKLKDKLSNSYEVYFKALNNCKYIDMRMEKDISVNELNSLVERAKNALKMVINSDPEYYESEKEIVEKVYDTVYRLIKLELLMTSESKLFDYASKIDINISFFNKEVIDDLDKLEISTDDVIYEKIYNINSDGICVNYFDLELIVLLLQADKDIDFKQKIVDKLNSLNDKIKNSNSKISSSSSLIKDKNNRRNGIKKNITSCRRQINKRFISLILALSVYIGGPYLFTRASKKFSTRNEYIKYVDTYTSKDDYTTRSEKVYRNHEPVDTTCVIYYNYSKSFGGEYTNGGTCISYSITSDNDYQLEDYFNLSQEELSNFYWAKKEESQHFSKKDTSNIDISDGVSTEVIKTTYDFVQKYFDIDAYYCSNVVVHVILLVIFLILECCTELPLVSDSISEIFYNFGKLKDNKNNLRNNKQEIDDLCKIIIDEINNNMECQKDFIDLVNKNRFLLSNNSELINSLIDNNIIEEAKKLVRKNK